MLDEIMLSDKLKVARGWFEGAQKGDFDLTGPQGAKFAELLGEAERHAARIEQSIQGTQRETPTVAAPPTPSPDPVYMPDEFRPQGHLRDMARPTGGSVLQFIRGMAAPKGVRP